MGDGSTLAVSLALDDAWYVSAVLREEARRLDRLAEGFAADDRMAKHAAVFTRGAARCVAGALAIEDALRGRS